MPPVPPAVAAQQQAQPPIRQFAQGAQGAPMAGAQQTIQASPSMQMVDGELQNAAKSLEKIAQVLVQEKPELVPILKQIVQGMAMLGNQIKAGQGTASPQGGDQGTQDDSAPQAAGGAAMGMGAG